MTIIPLKTWDDLTSEAGYALALSVATEPMPTSARLYHQYKALRLAAVIADLPREWTVESDGQYVLSPPDARSVRKLLARSFRPEIESEIVYTRSWRDKNGSRILSSDFDSPGQYYAAIVAAVQNWIDTGE